MKTDTETQEQEFTVGSGDLTVRFTVEVRDHTYRVKAVPVLACCPTGRINTMTSRYFCTSCNQVLPIKRSVEVRLVQQELGPDGYLKWARFDSDAFMPALTEWASLALRDPHIYTRHADAIGRKAGDVLGAQAEAMAQEAMDAFVAAFPVPAQPPREAASAPEVTELLRSLRLELASTSSVSWEDLSLEQASDLLDVSLPFLTPKNAIEILQALTTSSHLPGLQSYFKPLFSLAMGNNQPDAMRVRNRAVLKDLLPIFDKHMPRATAR